MKAYELLNSPTRWTTGAIARDIHNYEILSSDPNATCWCAIGAISKCYNNEHYTPYDKLFQYVMRFTNFINIVDWNDSNTYEDVVKVLKELDI